MLRRHHPRPGSPLSDPRRRPPDPLRQESAQVARAASLRKSRRSSWSRRARSELPDLSTEQAQEEHELKVKSFLSQIPLRGFPHADFSPPRSGFLLSCGVFCPLFARAYPRMTPTPVAPFIPIRGRLDVQLSGWKSPCQPPKDSEPEDCSLPVALSGQPIEFPLVLAPVSEPGTAASVARSFEIIDLGGALLEGILTVYSIEPLYRRTFPLSPDSARIDGAGKGSLPPVREVGKRRKGPSAFDLRRPRWPAHAHSVGSDGAVEVRHFL